MTTITDRISASGHDCYDTGNGNHPGFSSTGSLQFGNDSDALYDGMIWDSVSIPDGATIDTGCYIQLTDVSFGSSGSPEVMHVRGIETTTLTAWTSGDGPPDRSASYTTADVTWSTTWSHLSTFNSPEIKTVIQEIVDDTTGTVTDLTLILQDQDPAGSGWYDVESYDSTSAEAPYINIEYTAGGGGGGVPAGTLGLMGVGI